MGNKKKKNNNSIKLNNSFSSVILPTIIILSTIVLIGAAIINLGIRGNNVVDNNDIWEKAFEDVESKKVGVQFETIHTTEEVYTALRIECNKYIEQIDNRPDTVVNTDTNIDEEVFVDNKNTKTTEVKYTMEDVSETGPIYFKDKLLIRYITTDGELKIVAAVMDNDTDEIVVSNKNDIYYKLITENVDTDHEDTTIINEYDYLEEISRITINIMEADTAKKLQEYQKESLSYFTLDGNKSVIDSRKTINPNNKSSIQKVFIEAGKSDINTLYKDRIYMQIVTKEGKEVNTFGVILKLNQNSRIFDIDII